MSFEKRNPLPPGRYWIDVSGTDKVSGFAFLLSQAAALGAVVVENVELNGASVDLGSVLEALEGGNNPAAWFLFRVTDVGTFSIDQSQLGFATIADPNVHSQDDTVQKPDPVGDAQDTLKTMIAVLEGVAVVITLKTVLDFFKSMRGHV